MNDVTRILSAIEHGDAKAGDELLPLVYDELRKLAAARLARENPGQTLDGTALVHEAYLKLSARPGGWNDDNHFFSSAALAMRRRLYPLWLYCQWLHFRTALHFAPGGRTCARRHSSWQL